MNFEFQGGCRVLVLNERDPLHPKAGGAEVHVSEIFGRLARSGHEVTQFSSGWRGATSVEMVNDIRIRRFGELARYYPSVLARTARETRKNRFDIVVECLNKVPYYSPVYSAVPVLALCHHLFGEVAFAQVAWPIAATVWAAERLIPTLYRKCPFVTISESSRADLVARGIPAERVEVSHPGIEVPRIEINLESRRDPKVIFVGRLEVYKKVDVMLRALARIVDRFPELEITIVGRGPARTALMHLAHELGLSRRTRFPGFVSRDERDRLLAEARVCVCPSEKEGWGLTVIEANATATPVVATNADGLRDSVRDGETGFLVGDGDIVGFADRIAQLLANDALASRMARASLRWSRHFDWDNAADEMAQALARARSLA